jgi:hypothetical protein
MACHTAGLNPGWELELTQLQAWGFWAWRQFYTLVRAEAS